MRKATLVLLVGAVCGGAATYALLGSGSDGTSASGKSFLGNLTGLATSRGGAREARPASVATRLASYRSAAAHDEPSALEAALERAATSDPTPARDLEIDALLARLGELDAARAARVAQRLDLDARFVADAWLTWAEQDGEAALAGLETLRAAGTRRAAHARSGTARRWIPARHHRVRPVLGHDGRRDLGVQGVRRPVGR
jgi:hypothetical protein